MYQCLSSPVIDRKSKQSETKSPPNVLYYRPLNLKSVHPSYQLFIAEYVLLITGALS